MTKLQKLLTKIFMPRMAQGEKLEEPKLKTTPRGEAIDKTQWLSETRAGQLYSSERFYVIDKPNPTLEELEELHRKELAHAAKKVYSNSNIVLDEDYKDKTKQCKEVNYGN